MQPQVPGPKIMLVGRSGGGKTYALYTLVKSGMELFILATDNGIETIGKWVPDGRLTQAEMKRVHYHYFPPATSSWDALKATGQVLNTFGNESLQKMEDAHKSKYTQLLDLLDCCNNFVDQHGEKFGDVMTWGHDRVLVLDNCSGLNIMTMNIAVGAKPLKTQPDWGKAMDYEERLITTLTSINAPFVLIAHLEKETDELTGALDQMAGMLGRKLAPKMPRFFSDVILARRDGLKYVWSTAAMNVDLKTRNLQMGDNLDANFVPLFENWRKTGALIQPPTAATVTPIGR